MLIAIAAALLVLEVLVIKSFKNAGNVRNVNLFRASLITGALSAVVCLALVIPSFQYIQRYQSVNSGCPPSYPYAWAILGTGLIGLGAFASSATLAAKSRQTISCLSIAGATILLLLLVAGAFVAATFCLTF